jgi:uncharacterized protein (DUF58 family)
MKDYRKYLRPEAVAQLQNFEMIAKLVVEGFITGLHRSPYHGFSVEFAEYRPYRHGDETKNIDWKVFGRTERYYVKQFEEETNLRSMIAMDTSASMAYASKGHISKFDYSAYLSAALAMLLIKQRDAVGLALYDTEINKILMPNSKPSFISEILKSLSDVKPSNETETAAALDRLAERIKRRSLVIVLSDFFDDTDSVLKALKHFRHRNNEVIAFQILDPRELDFKFGYNANFIDMESGEEIITQPYQIRNAYSEAVKSFTDKIRKECLNHQIDYNLITTDQPFDKALRSFLAKRAKL